MYEQNLVTAVESCEVGIADTEDGQQEQALKNALAIKSLDLAHEGIVLDSSAEPTFEGKLLIARDFKQEDSPTLAENEFLIPGPTPEPAAVGQILHPRVHVGEISVWPPA